MKRWITWGLLIGVLLTFTIPFRSRGYVFDWDQADDYEKTESIANGKMTLIGPRVTSDQGFFLGPWHYYFLLPFYKITGGNLEMGFWAALAIQLATAIIFYEAGKIMFGEAAGLTAGLLAAGTPVLIAWGFMYVPVLAMLFFYLSFKTWDKPKLLPYLWLLFGIGCTTYTVFYALGLPLLTVNYLLLKNKKVKWRRVFWGMILFLLPYLPLIAFDLRHEFLNIKNAFQFVGRTEGNGSSAGYFLQVIYRSAVNWWTGRPVDLLPGNLFFIGSMAALIWGCLHLFKNEKRGVMIAWLLSSPLPMAFYRGNVSEYYFIPIVMLAPVMAAIYVTKLKYGKYVLAAGIALMLGWRLYEKISRKGGVVLADKVEIVKKMDGLNSPYSISYNLPLGEDSGYNLVFRKMGKNYVADGSAPLYTISYYNPKNEVEPVIKTAKLAVEKR